MKKKLITYSCALLVVCVAVLTACFTRNNFGYPYLVKFSQKGGTKTIKGDNFFTNIEINDVKGNGNYAEGDCFNDPSMTVTYDWLTVEQVRGSNSLIVTVAPMEGQQSRRLYIRAYSAMEYAEITVKQKK